VLFSGGKDSVYALHLAYLQGYDIVVLLTIIPEYDYSMLYHRPVQELITLQAKALDIPLEIQHVYVNEREAEVYALRELLARARDRYGVDTIVTGAIASDYQRLTFDMIASEVGLKTYSPLWGIDQEEYVNELLTNGIEFILLSATTYGLPPKFVGRVLSRVDMREIIALSKKYGFNPAFEGGEAETLVVNAPLFKKRLVVSGRVVRRGPYEYFYVVEKAVLL